MAVLTMVSIRTITTRAIPAMMINDSKNVGSTLTPPSFSKAKMGLEAAKLGTEMVGMGIKAGLGTWMLRGLSKVPKGPLERVGIR